MFDVDHIKLTALEPSIENTDPYADTLCEHTGHTLQSIINKIHKDGVIYRGESSSTLIGRVFVYTILVGEASPIGHFMRDMFGKYEYTLEDDIAAEYVLRHSNIIEQSINSSRVIDSIGERTPTSILGDSLHEYSKHADTILLMSIVIDSADFIYDKYGDNIQSELYSDFVNDSIDKLNSLFYWEAQVRGLRFPLSQMADNPAFILNLGAMYEDRKLFNVFKHKALEGEKILDSIEFHGDGFYGDVYQFDATTNMYVNTLTLTDLDIVDSLDTQEVSEFEHYSLRGGFNLTLTGTSPIKHSHASLIIKLNNRYIGDLAILRDENNSTLSLSSRRKYDLRYLAAFSSLIYKHACINKTNTKPSKNIDRLLMSLNGMLTDDNYSCEFRTNQAFNKSIVERFENNASYTESVINHFNHVHDIPIDDSAFLFSHENMAELDFGTLNDIPAIDTAQQIQYA